MKSDISVVIPLYNKEKEIACHPPFGAGTNLAAS